MEYLTNIVVALIAAGAGGILTFVLGFKKSKRDDFELLYGKIELDNKRLRKDMDSLKDEFVLLRDELSAEKALTQTLQSKLILLETAHHDLPFPQWLKDTDGKMLAVNNAYEKMFLNPIGKTALEYVGRFDINIWPADVAKKFSENDSFALSSKTGYWIGKEPIWIKNSDISERWIIVKYARYVGNTCIGIAGIAIPAIKKG